MSYLTQLQSVGNALTLKRKKEYISHNFGKTINHLLKKKNSSILEIGPGFGEFVEYCSDLKINKIDIVERDKSVINFLKKNYKLRTVFLNQNIWKIDRKLKKYDVIIMTQVLEHILVSDHIKVLKTLYKHLAVNGVLIITVPNIGNPLATFERYYDYTHHTAFTEHSLEQMTDYAQLKNSKIMIQGFHIPPVSPINIIRILMQSILHGFFKLLYIINGGVYPRILTTNISLIVEKTV
jgi:2-polyprenyl-3-methyl-5-hydroxy-6-metoxy-1,4-benzoquinol methylase